MFQVIIPYESDIIYFNVASGSAPFVVPGLIKRSRIAQAKSYGLRPTERTADRFGNKSCVHLNLIGNIYAVDGIPKTKSLIGSRYLDSSLRTLTNYYGYIYPGYSGAISDILFVGEDKSFDIPTYYDRYSTYIIKYESTLAYYWLSQNRLRVERRLVRTRLDTGALMSNVLTVIYYQYDWTKTPMRYRSIVKTLSNGEKPVPWIYPTTSYASATSKYTVPSTPVVPKIDLRDFRWRLSKALQEMTADDSSSFGQLTLDAAQGLRVVKVNLYTYLIEAEWITQIGSYASKLKNVTKTLSKLHLSIKGISTGYLAYKYGIKLTYLDTRELFGRIRSSVGMSKDRWTSSRARKNSQSSVHVNGKLYSVSNQYNMKLYCERHSSAIIAAWAQLLVTGVYPLTETAWDAIPFSFVVDWFLRLDDLLTAIDANTILNSYNISSCVYSSRAEFRIPISELFPEWEGILFGDLTVVYYRRYVEKSPPPIHLNYQTPQSFTHWVEGAALIVQQL